jgi:ABC-type phosphate transport system permease subunit
MCAIFILYFVLFLFVTCFGWNFSAIVVVVVVGVVVVSVVVVITETDHPIVGRQRVRTKNNGQ